MPQLDDEYWLMVDDYLGPPADSSQHSSSDSHSIDVAIETYRQMPVLSQDADALRFWEANSAATVLQPQLLQYQQQKPFVSNFSRRGGASFNKCTCWVPGWSLSR